MQEKHACKHSHTHIHTHKFLSQGLFWEPKVRSEDVVVVNIVWCFRRMVQAAAPEKQPCAYGFCSHLSLRQSTKLSHTLTDRWETYQLLLMPPPPVGPLRCSSPLLLMIGLILRKETKIRGCPLISSLWTSSGCGCYCLPQSVPTHTHTHKPTHTVTHTHITTTSDRHVGL